GSQRVMPLRFDKILIADERYESAGVFDVDNDGHLDIVSGAYWYPGPDFRRRCPIGEVLAVNEYFDDFSTIPVDVDGDGYLDVVGCRDLVLSSGWIEGDSWTFHPEFELGLASIPIIVADVNGDGLADLIVGQAHGYGLDWWEQQVLGGRRRWVQHPIDPHNSQ